MSGFLNDPYKERINALVGWLLSWKHSPLIQSCVNINIRDLICDYLGKHTIIMPNKLWYSNSVYLQMAWYEYNDSPSYNGKTPLNGMLYAWEDGHARYIPCHVCLMPCWRRGTFFCDTHAKKLPSTCGCHHCAKEGGTGAFYMQCKERIVRKAGVLMCNCPLDRRYMLESCALNHKGIKIEIY